MCGRAAQTYQSVRAAEDLLLGDTSSNTHTGGGGGGGHGGHAGRDESAHQVQDNYNMSPGMSATIFFKDENNVIRRDRKVWGLVPRGGSAKSPLPEGMSQHFSNLMFNARSDTLLDKRTFAPLFRQGRTCVVALDGFFEWKPTLKGGKKQPYYVTRKDKERPYLLLPGLWTSVPTGRLEDPRLDTFTLITTDACSELTWLHSRMPLCFYEEHLAREWLERPSVKLYKHLDSSTPPPDFFEWHAVTKEMSSTKFRGPDSIRPIKPPASVKSYFSQGQSTTRATTATTSSLLSIKESANAQKSPSTMPSLKRDAASPEPAFSSAKKLKTFVKKGPIDSFFSPKSK